MGRGGDACAHASKFPSGRSVRHRVNLDDKARPLYDNSGVPVRRLYTQADLPQIGARKYLGYPRAGPVIKRGIHAPIAASSTHAAVRRLHRPKKQPALPNIARARRQRSSVASICLR